MIRIERIKELHEELSQLYEEGVLHISNYSPAKVQMRYPELLKLAKENGITELSVIRNRGLCPYHVYFIHSGIEFYSLCDEQDLGLPVPTGFKLQVQGVAV